ncbi:glucose-1-phosphate adenylyltransferase [Kocuria palustris]|uniref:glucose-1-phosphate adenylyltransferase n=1 Tax=Kocuria palustris TaxID=71999 RepID=UPI0011AABF37|nr:glucose-1-phosphate adenylyltransferase [Kocuria palustris]
MARPNVLAIVLAGGEGKRLMPLTEDRAKPAVPFGGSYRLIDFALSNLVNSGYLQIVVLTQYKSHSMDRHLSETWRLSTLLGNYIASVPAQQRSGKDWFLGSANAIFQSMNLIDDARPDYVVVVGADHVYRMDFSQMLDFHIQKGVQATVAGVRQPLELVRSFGVIETEAEDPQKISQFVEKPDSTEPLPDDPGQFLASMGNYIFTTDALVEALHADDATEGSKHDMGGDIMPYFSERGEAAVYDFTFNDVPGSTDRDRQYWRDVGTLDSYYDSHMDLLRPLPIFNLYNEQWKIYTHQVTAPPAKLVRGPYQEGGIATDSILSSGVIVAGGRVQESVLSPRVTVGNHARVSESVLLNSVAVHDDAIVERCIVDKNVVIPQGVRVGVDPQEDRSRGLTVTESGITIVPKNFTFH